MSVGKFPCFARRAPRLGAVALVSLIANLAGPPAWADPQGAASADEVTVRRTAPLRQFHIDEGRNHNAFYQSARIAAHALVRRGTEPRVLVATPAANSGVGVWFESVAPGATDLTMRGRLREVERAGMTGVELTVRGPRTLVVRRVLLDSVRALRDENGGAMKGREAIVERALAELARAPASDGVTRLRSRLEQWLTPLTIADPSRPDALILERTSVAGHRYRLELIPLAGTRVTRGDDGRVAIEGRGRTDLRVAAFFDRPPLRPLGRVLRDPRAGLRDQERNLGFLSYQEAFLAGSWQYLTYFGRDTLVGASLLGARASTDAHAAAIGSVLDRVSPRGGVAHEENVGDQAVLERILEFARGVASGKVAATTESLAALERPLYDYKMIDGEYLLPPLLARHLADASPARIAATLTDARVDALARVAARIAEQTARFETSGAAADLIAINRGEKVGNWRDSHIGLGGGTVPLDVNAYLVPAALRAFADVVGHPAFPRARFLAALERRRPQVAALFGSADALRARATRWSRAGAAFDVRLPADDARARLRAYLASLPPAERAALGKGRLWSGATVAAALSGEVAAPELDGVVVRGVALDADRRPVPVQSSDEAFELFLGEPTADDVVAMVTRMFQPFPVGLATPVGLVVANPAYSGRPADLADFSRAKYHGAVIWGWPQNMIRQGLERQLARHRGDRRARAVLGRALAEMKRTERRAGRFFASELWTWAAGRGRIVAEAFGQSAGHSDESNALQLWSNTR